MNADKLFNAMNYVEERFIAEADSVRPRAARHWLRVATTAACFVLVLTAAVTLFPQVRSDNTKESLQAESLFYNGVLNPEVGEMETVADMEGISDKAAQAVFDGLLRVVSVHDGGFVATVEKISAAGSLPAGTEVKVVYDENITVIENDGELVTCTRREPTEEELPVGGVVKVRFMLAYDGTLRVSHIGKEDAF